MIVLDEQLLGRGLERDIAQWYRGTVQCITDLRPHTMIKVVALVGEPGVGKSCLVYELLHSHRTQGWLLLESSSVSYGKATPYLPVIDLLKGYCGMATRGETRRVREKVVGKVLGLDEALRPVLAPLLALLDVPVIDQALPLGAL